MKQTLYTIKSLVWLFAMMFSINALANTSDGGDLVITVPASSPTENIYFASPLTDWLENYGDAQAGTSPFCMPITWSHNYDPANFQSTCGPYTGSVTVTFTATDDCGEQISTTGTITLVDETSPQCIKPEDLTIDCTNIGDLDAWLANNWDAQDQSEPIAISNDFAGMNNLDVYADGAIVTWSFIDACGNETLKEALLTIDPAAPMFTFVPADYHVACPEMPVFGMPTVNDPSAIITFEDVQLGLGCPTGYTVQRTWTATNACGSVTATQTITVEPGDDTIEFEFVPIDVTIDCDQFYEFGEPIVSTGCPDGGLVVTFEDELSSGGCDQPFTVIRTWTAVDACGGLAQASQTINSGPDNNAPIFGNNPASITVDCGEAPVLPDAFDFCGAITLTHEDVVMSGDCETGKQINRTWTATDLCGNASTFSQMVTTNADNTAPVFTFVPYGQVFDCDEGYTFSDPVVVDACSNVTVTFEDEFFGSDCSNGFGYDVYRTWTAIDECGNVSTAGAAAWIVPGANSGNTVAFLSRPEPTIVPCGTAVKFEEPTYRTLCRDGAELTYIDEFKTLSSGNILQTRTWTVTDNCDNAASVVQIVVFECLATEAIGKGTAEMQVYQNQPNPFKGTTMIHFQLPSANAANLVVMDERLE